MRIVTFKFFFHYGKFSLNTIIIYPLILEYIKNRKNHHGQNTFDKKCLNIYIFIS
jgi:hypothetical protein